MPNTKNLCAPIPLELFARVCEGREKAGLTNSAYITQVLTEYYEWKENGGKLMAQENGKTRTLAFQISEELFQRIKAHLERETARTGKKFTQRDFVIGLIEAALAEAERESAVDSGGMPEDAERQDSIIGTAEEAEQQDTAETNSGTTEEPGQPDDTEPDNAPEETESEASYEDGGTAEDGEASQYPEEG